MTRQALLTGLGLVAGCTIAPAANGPAAPAEVTLIPPSGYGTLLQSEVSLSLAAGPLDIRVTPLDESGTRVTAPDTESRLRGIAASERAGLPDASTLFLVQFFTEEADVSFVPEEVQLVTRGLRVLPMAITPVTPGWGQRRVLQRETQMAVYAFPESVDLESELVLVYGFDQTSSWSSILSRIRAERARARARASRDQASSSYLEILR